MARNPDTSIKRWRGAHCDLSLGGDAPDGNLHGELLPLTQNSSPWVSATSYQKGTRAQIPPKQTRPSSREARTRVPTFSVVYFSRDTLPRKKKKRRKGKRALLGDLGYPPRVPMTLLTRGHDPKESPVMTPIFEGTRRLQQSKPRGTLHTHRLARFASHPRSAPRRRFQPRMEHVAQVAVTHLSRGGPL